MNYTNLTKTQKLCVDEFIKVRPELKSVTTITRQEVEELWHVTYDKRLAGTGPKFGYPMWLIKGPKVSRGNYVWPAPNVDNTSAIDALAKRVAQTTKEDEEFLAELQEAGVEV